MIVLPHQLEPGEYLVSMVIKVEGLTVTSPRSDRDIDESWVHLPNTIVREHSKVEAAISKQIKDALAVTEAFIRNNDVQGKGTAHITVYLIADCEDNKYVMRTILLHEHLKDDDPRYKDDLRYEDATNNIIASLERDFCPVLAFSTDFDPSQGFPSPQAFLQALTGLWGQGKSRP